MLVALVSYFTLFCYLHINHKYRILCVSSGTILNVGSFLLNIVLIICNNKLMFQLT